MIVKNFMHKRSISVHITIVSICLFFGLWAAVGWLSHAKMSEILTFSTQKSVAAMGANIEQDFLEAYRLVESSVEILSKSGLKDAQNLEQRLEFLPLMASVSLLQEQVSALKAGYANGDYFVVSNLQDAAGRQRFVATKDTQFVVDHWSNNTGSTIHQRLFFSAKLEQIGPRVRSVNVAAQDNDDHRQAAWFNQATAQVGITKASFLPFLRSVGFTISRSVQNKAAVIAIDVTLKNMSKLLNKRVQRSSTELILTNPEGWVIGHKNLLNTDNTAIPLPRVQHIEEIGSPVLSQLYLSGQLDDQNIDFTFDDKRRLGYSNWLHFAQSKLLLTVTFVEDELLHEVYAIRQQVQILSLLLFILFLPLIWFMAHRISMPIKQLLIQAKDIKNFDFSNRSLVTSPFREIDELAYSIHMMKQTISSYNDMINTLSGEREFNKLLLLVAQSTRKISQVDMAAVFLLNDDLLSFELAEYDDGNKVHLILEGLPDMEFSGPMAIPGVSEAIQQKKVTRFVLTENMVNDQTIGIMLRYVGHTKINLACVPLIDRHKVVIGVLFLGDGEEYVDDAYGDNWIGFIKMLSGFAALSIENRQLIENQKDLMESFIKLLASAIDAKSPYTGGHCQRVPEITKMLARAACEDKSGTYKDFDLSAEQWEELHYACWLHDCGKVTTPEFVVDKATKLETNYDRIHEIRMRFEVLKRDAQIDFWSQLQAGGSHEHLEASLKRKLGELDKDFAFIGECNLGAEFMANDKVARLRSISKRTWHRTLSDRIGISWEEQLRKQRQGVETLPFEEQLIADKNEHIIHRSPSDKMPVDNPWGFTIKEPEHKYNRGELYNLAVSRGTLSAEERYKINEHMIQTIIMLEQLPFPKHLQQVPVIACGHHETMDGKGYPRGLKKDEMPITARMLAIADIFEALTAADRPYKKAKTLTQALAIMEKMSNNQHIDSELYALFISSGVYLEYAKKNLTSAQLDQDTVKSSTAQTPSHTKTSDEPTTSNQLGTAKQ